MAAAGEGDPLIGLRLRQVTSLLSVDIGGPRSRRRQALIDLAVFAATIIGVFVAAGMLVLFFIYPAMETFQGLMRGP